MKVELLCGYVRSYLFASAAICAAVLPSLPGCSIEFDPGPTPPAESPGDERPVEKVTVRLRNLTFTEAVDVEFFLSTDPLVTLPDDLFAEAFRIRANIGVAGTGILEPLSEDVIEFECGDDLTLGTSGGTFLDNESGEIRGVGSPRWAQNAPLGFCGHVVMFDFIAVEEGFDTIIRLGD